MTLDILIAGFGIGLVGGIVNGIASAYKKGHWLTAGYLIIFGVSLVADPYPQLINGDQSWLISSIPTMFVTSWRTEKAFKPKQNSSIST
jgi:hypothetical protein